MGVKRAALALALASLLAPAVRAVAAGAAKTPLLQTLAQAEVDWESDSVSARGGAAADLRLPGPDNARPAARRAAEKQAADRLAEALKQLPLGGARHLSDQSIAAALGRAKARDIDYQSNGGVMLSLGVDFTDLAAVAEKDKDKETDKEPPPAAAATATPKLPRATAPGKATRVPDLERASGAPVPARAVETPAGEAVPELLLSVPSMPLELAPRLLVGGVEKSVGSAVYRLGEAPKARKAHPARRDKSGRLVVSLPSAEAARVTGGHAIIYVRSVSKR